MIDLYYFTLVYTDNKLDLGLLTKERVKWNKTESHIFLLLFSHYLGNT